MNMQNISRAAERRPLGLLVKSRVQSRLIYCDLIDISEGGCKIKASQGFAEVGDRVILKVGAVNAPLGRIAWIDGRMAGVAFEGEMHEAVLDHLCKHNGLDLAKDKDDRRTV